MLEAAEFISILCSTLFTGAAIYVSLVEHPARMACGTELAAKEWAPSYKRGARMQAPLAVVGTLTALVSWRLSDNVLWLVGALLIFSVIPFTLLVIKPTNNLLFDPERDRRSAETRALLEKWGRLHALRSIIGLLASGVLLIAVLRID